MDEVAVVRLGLMAYRVPLEVVLEVVLGVERTVCAPTVTREVSMAHAPTRPAALALHDSLALHDWDDLQDDSDDWDDWDDSDDSIWDTRRRGDQGLATGRRRQGRGLGH